MSVSAIYPFTTPSNYLVNNAVISGGKAQLSPSILGGRFFSQAFTTDTGFTYNAAEAEFAAGQVQQKDVTPTNSLFGVRYATDANPITTEADLDWHKSGGSVTATLNGAPTIVGGNLVCTGTQGLYYTRNTNTIETHKFIYTPNYTTSPPANINVNSNWNGTNNNDRFNLTNSPSGNTLRLTLYNNVGGSVIGVATTVGPAWTPTAGVDYEFEIVIDSIAGTVRVFIDGVLHGTNSPGGWTRGTAASRFYLGASPSIYDRGEASFDDYIMFSDAQHTVGYTPGYTIDPFIFVETKVDLPTFTYVGPGAVQTLDGFTTTEANSPRYLIDGNYWNGAAWVVSTGTYAQANDKATVLANVAAFNAAGLPDLDVSVVFPDQNVQGSVDQLDVEYSGDFYQDGSVEGNVSFQAEDIVTYTNTVTEPGSDEIRYAIYVGSQLKWWSGAAWVNSLGTVAETNTFADFTTNLPTLLTGNSLVRPFWFLNTTNGETTPDIDIAQFDFDFGGVQPTVPAPIQTFAYVLDNQGVPLNLATVTIFANISTGGYQEQSDHMVMKTTLTVLTDALGYFEIPLLPGTYRLFIEEATSLGALTKKTDGTKITFTVPSGVASVNLTTLINP